MILPGRSTPEGDEIP
jgi:serine/threonine protein kinase